LILTFNKSSENSDENDDTADDKDVNSDDDSEDIDDYCGDSNENDGMMLSYMEYFNDDYAIILTVVMRIIMILLLEEL